MVYSNILEAVGHTPMVRLNRMVPADCADVLVKFEGLNVGGSIKTRTALNMLEDAERRGLLHPDTIIVEPTSGNQGIGLALCGAVKGYTVKIIMPDSVSEERRKLVQHYGAEVILVHDAGNIGDCIAECQRIADEMAANDPNVFVPGQFDNPANPAVIRTSKDLARLEGLMCGISSGTNVAAAIQLAKKLGPGKTVVTVLPDTAERYFSTPLFGEE